MDNITIEKSEFKELLIQAANLGAQQAIEAARLSTQTKPFKKRIKLKEAAERLGVSFTWLRRRLIKSTDPLHVKHYDPNSPKPHRLSDSENAPLYVWEHEIVEWYDNLTKAA